MASPVITTVSPEQPLVRSHGGKLNISWRDSLNVAAPARFGVWLVDLASNGWYGGWVFDADGSGAYSREIAAVGCPDNVPLSPVVYYAESPGAGWGGDSGSCYGFAPSTVTLLPFSVAAVEPAHAVAGTPVTVRGTGFTNGLTDVWFGPDAAPRCAVISDTEAIAYVPAGPRRPVRRVRDLRRADHRLRTVHHRRQPHGPGPEHHRHRPGQRRAGRGRDHQRQRAGQPDRA